MLCIPNSDLNLFFLGAKQEKHYSGELDPLHEQHLIAAVIAVVQLILLLTYPFCSLVLFGVRVLGPAVLFMSN